MVVICALCVGIFMQITFERLLQSTGKTLFIMISQGTGAIINIIFDPILIFGLFGFPKMGVIGAAVATVAGQLCGMLLGLIFNLKFNHELHLSLKGFRPDLSIIKGIYVVGIPSIIMQAIGSVMTFGMNKILMQFTSTAAAVFGVYFKLNSFVFMPIFGLNNAMVPIVAYNYGARQKKRITHTVRLSIITAICFMLAGRRLFPLYSRYTSGNLRCFGKHAVHRYPGFADHLYQLLLRRPQHYFKFRLPGAGKWTLQPVGIFRPSDRDYPAGRLSSGKILRP